MKYYCFYYFWTVAEHTLIGKLLTWLAFVIGSVFCWWRYFLFTVRHYLHRTTDMPKQKMLFTFRPFELTRIDYKSYQKGMGSGINMYPKGRSGHRIAVNDTDLFCFGGTLPFQWIIFLFCRASEQIILFSHSCFSLKPINHIGGSFRQKGERWIGPH